MCHSPMQPSAIISVIAVDAVDSTQLKMSSFASSDGEKEGFSHPAQFEGK